MSEKELKLDLIEYLEENDIEFNGPNQRGWITLEECPFCSKRNKAYIMIERDTEFDNLPLGFVNCYSCTKRGGFESILMELENISYKDAMTKLYKEGTKNEDRSLGFNQKDIHEKEGATSVHDVIKSLREMDMPTGSKPFFDWEEEDRKDGLEYLLNRGLTEEVIKKLEVHLIPYMDWNRASELAIETLVCEEDKKKSVKKSYKDFIRNNGNPTKDMTPEQYEFLKRVKEVSADIKRFSGRVIFPSLLGKKVLGYIARAYTKDFFGPKVLNSSGPLTSVALTNFNNVQSAQSIVFVEGIFDAVSTGIHQSIPLLGKYINKKQGRFKLLSLLKAKEAIIFGDPDAKKELYEMAEVLLDVFEKVKIVRTPSYLTRSPQSKSDLKVFKALGGHFKKNEAVLDASRLKVFQKILKTIHKHPNLIEKKRYKIEVLNALERRYGKLTETQKGHYFNILKIFSKKEAKWLSLESGGEFFLEVGTKDANDFGESLCQKLMDEAPYFSPGYSLFVDEDEDAIFSMEEE